MCGYIVHDTQQASEEVNDGRGGQGHADTADGADHGRHTAVHGHHQPLPLPAAGDEQRPAGLSRDSKRGLGVWGGPDVNNVAYVAVSAPRCHIIQFSVMTLSKHRPSATSSRSDGA
eukprot:scaffold66065_cov54-Phaeocystis_antarctica.AAC.1